MSTDVAPLPQGMTVNLSLISHTNAGKTTLARTLLGRDVGEVRDAAHVTDLASAYVMLQSGADALLLWDTPGFGDTVRLLKRLKLSGNPLGWLLTQVWDRFRERPLWSSQQAVRNARDHSDLILYLVNASEEPGAASYVALELEILAWIGKPVILLLNQTGPPRPDGALEEARWQAHLRWSPVVRGALTLDAFARCWVQEATLLQAVTPLLPPEKRAAMAGLSAAWRAQNLDRFRASMRILALELAAAATDEEPLDPHDLQGKVGGVLRGLRGQERTEVRKAMQKLAERLEAGAAASTEALIREHELSGKAAVEVLRRLEKRYATVAPAKEGFAAVLGGLMSGALGGVAADLAAGGLTLGGGMIVGGLLGALAAGGAARGYNLVRGEQRPAVRWSHDLFQSLVRSALLRYLAVAHFGRGRGDYEESEYPPFWAGAVDDVAEPAQREIEALWEQGRGGDSAALAQRFERLLISCASRLLADLYPEARELFAGGAAADLERGSA